jgi:hypothetical protein
LASHSCADAAAAGIAAATQMSLDRKRRLLFTHLPSACLRQGQINQKI